MKQQLPFEFVYQVAALFIAVIFVHLVYVTVIRPNAEADMQAQALQIQLNPDAVPQRSIYVVLKDYEQEAPTSHATMLKLN